MNALVIGSDKTPILRYLPDNFLVIDDGSLIDQIHFPKRKAVTYFDTDTDSFNPLKDMDYRKACDLVAVLNDLFPGGENTLTKANASFQILEGLLNQPSRLDTVVSDTKDTRYAYQQLRRLLLSPVLKRVLDNPTNVSLKGTVVARLDRAELGNFDCFVLANLLISQFQGAIVVPDFGFYACGFHGSLIRQGRLIAGINSFDEVPELRSQLVLIERKIGSHCTPDDAALLALYAGIPRGINNYNDFIADNIGAP